MKVTQEKLPASQIGLQIEVSAETSQAAYEKTLKEFTRHANIPGFRKGKVPRQVLIQRFGATRIKAAVVEDLIQDSLRQAIEQEKIDAIGTPELRSSFDELVQTYEPGAILTFSAAVDVPPDVTLKTYAGLEVKAEEVVYDPQRVDETLANYQRRSATLVPVEGRAAQAGDLVTVDFMGQTVAEGEEPTEIPGGSATDFQVELTEGRFIPGFIDGIIGMNPGETKDVSATFPEDYPQAELAGKPALFTVTLKDVKERELPELDDDFAQEISEFETMAELRESLESRFQEEAVQKTKANKQEALLVELIKHIEVELPETLIRQEVDFSITQAALRLSEQGMDIKKAFTADLVSALRQQARPEAITRLQRTMALGEVAKQESISVEADDVNARVQEVLEDYQGQEVDISRLRQMVEEDLLKDKILQWLEENGTVELVPEGALTPEEEPQTTDSVEGALTLEEEPETVEALPEDASTATVEVDVEAIAETDEAEDAMVEAAVMDESDADEAPATEATPAKKSSRGSRKPKSAPED